MIKSTNQNLFFSGITILILIMAYPLLTACPLSGARPRLPEPKYAADRVWTVQMDSLRATWGPPFQIGQHLYMVDSTRFSSASTPTLSLEKRDIASGSLVWKTEPVPFGDDSSVCEWNGHLFIHCVNATYNEGYLLCYDEATGALEATVRLGGSVEEAMENESWINELATTEDGLYWGSISKRKAGAGLLRFDPSLIDFSKPPSLMQDIAPELVIPLDRGIHTCLEVDGDVIYFLTYNMYFDDPTAIQSQIGAWDTKARAMVWNFKTPYFTGRARKSLRIEGDILYVVDSTSPGAFDKNTGSVKFVQDMRNIDRTKVFRLGTSMIGQGFAIDNGKIYFTNSMHSATPSITDIPWDMVYNIVCIDAGTGELVWKNRPQGVFASLGTFPVVKDGRSYWVTDCGLRVYDADTGELVGVDDSIVSYGDEHPAYHEGIMVFKDDNYMNNTTVLTAIRI